MFKTTGSECENQAARQYLVDAGYTVLDGEVPGLFWLPALRVLRSEGLSSGIR